MTSSQIRNQARQNLAGKWGKAAIATLIFAIATYVISFVLAFIPVAGPIISAIISVPLSFGFLVTMLKLNDNEEISYLVFLDDGFKNFGKVWGVTLNMFLKLIVPIIFVVLCAILSAASIFAQNDLLSTLSFVLYIIAIIYMVYKSLIYSFSLYVLADNPEITGKEAVEKSAELMKGNVWKYICLNLSFIGWAILSTFTLGVGMLWLIPYMKVAEINFYRNLSGQI